MNYYYIPQPPFLLLVFGFFIGITCGLSFEAMLRQRVYAWSKNPAKYQLDKIQETGFIVPFWGTCLGIWVFLAGGLEVFNVDPLMAFSISVPLTVFTAGLVWSQLRQVLKQLEKGGSKALDLDAFDF
jgi:hypothetical protein